MGELVDALVRVLEFVVQGALAILLVGFLLAWVHGFKESVYQHAREMTAYMLGDSAKTLGHPNAVVTILIGVLYIAGIITNSVGYWLLHPAHEIVIAAAVPDARSVAQPRTVSAISLVRVVTARVMFGSSPPPGPEYLQYLVDEVEWRNRNLEAVKHALDPLLKQSRVIRGTAVISLGFFFVSIFKTISFLITFVLLSLSGTPHRWGSHMYRHLVDPHHGETSGAAKTSRVRRMTAVRYAVSNTLYAIVAFVVLWCALGGYATTEREYHVMAHAGKLTAAQIAQGELESRGASQQSRLAATQSAAPSIAAAQSAPLLSAPPEVDH